MQVLINDLLTFSRVGRLNDRRERVELRAASTARSTGSNTRCRTAARRIELAGRCRPWTAIRRC
jgi:hypothetical protein